MNVNAPLDHYALLPHSPLPSLPVLLPAAKRPPNPVRASTPDRGQREIERSVINYFLSESSRKHIRSTTRRQRHRQRWTLRRVLEVYMARWKLTARVKRVLDVVSTGRPPIQWRHSLLTIVNRVKRPRDVAPPPFLTVCKYFYVGTLHTTFSLRLLVLRQLQRDIIYAASNSVLYSVIWTIQYTVLYCVQTVVWGNQSINQKGLESDQSNKCYCETTITVLINKGSF